MRLSRSSLTYWVALALVLSKLTLAAPVCDTEVTKLDRPFRAGCYGLSESSYFNAPRKNAELSSQPGQELEITYYDYANSPYKKYEDGTLFRLAAGVAYACEARCLCEVTSNPVTQQVPQYCTLISRPAVPSGDPKIPYSNFCRASFAVKIPGLSIADYITQRKDKQGREYFSVTLSYWNKDTASFDYEQHEGPDLQELVRKATVAAKLSCDAEARYELQNSKLSCSQRCDKKLANDSDLYNAIDAALTRPKPMLCKTTWLEPIQPPPPGCEPKGRLNVNVVGNGTVKNLNSTLSCADSCWETYRDAGWAILEATPAQGYQFVRWVGGDRCDGTTSRSCSVKVEGTKNVTAEFAKLPHVAVKSGQGGRVFNTGATIGNTSHGYDGYVTRGSVIVLTAFSDPNFTFAGWSGACSGKGTCKITVNADATIQANFLSTRR